MPGKVVKGTFIVGSGKIVEKVITTIYVLVVANALLPGEYGLLSLALSVIVTVSVVFVGLSEATVKYIAEQPKNYGRARGVLYRVLKIRIVMGILFFLGIIVGSEWLGTSVFHKPEIIPLLRAWALLLLINPFYESISNFFLGVMNYAYMILTELTWYFFNLPCTLALILLGLGVYGVIFGQIGATMIATLISFFLLMKHYLRSGKQEEVAVTPHRKILTYASYSIGNKVIVNISQQMPILFLGAFALSSEVGYFSLAQGIASAVSILSGSIALSIFPTFSEAEATKDEGKLLTYFCRSIKYVFLLSLIMSIWLAMFSEPFLSVLFPKYKPAFLFLSAFAFTYIVFSLGDIWGSLLRGMGRLDLAVKIGLILLAPHVFLCAFLTQYFGGMGGIFSLLLWTLAASVMLIIFSPIKLPYPNMTVVRAVIVTTVLTVLVLSLIRVLLAISPIASLIVSVIAGGTAYFISLTLTGGFSEYDFKVITDITKSNRILRAADPVLLWLISKSPRRRD